MPGVSHNGWSAIPAWIGPDERPRMTWWSLPSSPSNGVGVVIVPPVGYEAWSAHRTLRTVAEGLAARGCTVVRYDPDATGDSAGESWDAGRMPAWKSDVGLAADALRHQGAASIVLLGLRAGASLALDQAHAVEASAVVAWAPINSGRRLVRQLRLLSTSVPDGAPVPHGDRAVVLAGSVFTEETLAELAALDLLELTAAPASKILVIERDDQQHDGALVAHLASLGATVDRYSADDIGTAIDRPTEYAEVPEASVAQVCDWVAGVVPTIDGQHSAVPPRSPTGLGPPARTQARMHWGDTLVDEEVLAIGRNNLVGVLTRPQRSPRATVLWLNSGSEHHVGPGRAWVEYGRTLAASGFASVRIDLSGWGESPDHEHAPGRPYDPHCVSETIQAGEALAESDLGPIVVAGLCAGAWVALRAALDHPFAGVVAFNPQLYWQPGDPIEANIATETRPRRRSEIARIERLRHWGVWSALDAVGIRHPAARWLRALERTGTPTLMAFAEDDDGLQFIESRLARSWSAVRRSGNIDLAVVDGIDHSMHRHWLRPRMIDAVASWLTTTFPADR